MELGLAAILGGTLAGGGLSLLWKRQSLRLATENAARILVERKAGEHLCLSTAEALAYAIEAAIPYNSGHLDCVRRCVLELGHAFQLAEDQVFALHIAALLHNVGRLGIPEHILNKKDILTPEEQEKLRSHPVLGARILASIPFSGAVVPTVQHHMEFWDGSGYPDGLKGSEIPLEARILAVANAYSALRHLRPYRPACTPTEALAEIEARAGTQFDPAVVTAFRPIAARIREEETPTGEMEAPTTRRITLKAQADAALRDISAAQRETAGLVALSQAVNDSLHLEALCETVIQSVRDIVPCAACALFLPDEAGDYLTAHAAAGVNYRYLQGSVARVGTYLTGRAFSRGTTVRASFLPDDLILREVSDPWTYLRSTIIVPLLAGGRSLGTLNLYAAEAEAFGPEAERVLRLVATQAGRAIENARKFASVQETAYTDALTGLRNGRFLREYLEREINRTGREHGTFAVLNMDLDNFKPINDRYGHATGDQTLRDIAEILRGHIRNYDLAARYAGDEFVVVLSQADRIAAEVVATKLKLGVERYGEKLLARDPEFPSPGVSIGIALYPFDGEDISALLCHSDAAMYQDKIARKKGRPSLREHQVS